MLLQKRPLQAKKTNIKKKVNKVSIPKKLTSFRTLVLTRHPSHQGLRTLLPRLPFRSLVRLGSTTVSPNGISRVEINSIQGVKNSANKLLMKRCFTRDGVKTADWWTTNNGNGFNHRGNPGMNTIQELPYPIIAKSLHGSRGEGNFKLDNQRALEQWIVGKTLSNYIFEEYFAPNKRIAEYRVHCTSKGAFYSCRKMLKNGTPEELRFQRHSDNCVWITEDSTTGLFDKPQNWNVITNECVKALKSLGLDIACFDIKVLAKKDQKGKIRTNPDFIIIESNSAASLAEVGIQHYLREIPLILKEKHSFLKNNR